MGVFLDQYSPNILYDKHLSQVFYKKTISICWEKNYKFSVYSYSQLPQSVINGHYYLGLSGPAQNIKIGIITLDGPPWLHLSWLQPSLICLMVQPATHIYLLQLQIHLWWPITTFIRVITLIIHLPKPNTLFNHLNMNNNVNDLMLI